MHDDACIHIYIDIQAGFMHYNAVVKTTHGCKIIILSTASS